MDGESGSEGKGLFAPFVRALVGTLVCVDADVLRTASAQRPPRSPFAKTNLRKRRRLREALPARLANERPISCAPHQLPPQQIENQQRRRTRMSLQMPHHLLPLRKPLIPSPLAPIPQIGRAHV